MSRKKVRSRKHTAPVSTSEESVFTPAAYIASVMARLNGPLASTALDVITRLGVFAAEDPNLLSALIFELDETPPDENARVLAAQKRAVHGATIDERRAAICELESLEFHELERVCDSAYLLGIAVGQRLGAGALQSVGGAR